MVFAEAVRSFVSRFHLPKPAHALTADVFFLYNREFGELMEEKICMNNLFEMVLSLPFA
jgi:hypothetical protein